MISRPLLSATFIIAGAVTGASILLSAYGGVAQSAGQPAHEPAIRYVPDDVQDSSWLKRVAADQVKAIAGVSAFHNFQFTDRVAASGITFKHRIVDDAGKTYKAAHYDHGNGIAIADVDGDGLTDIYFVSQVGGNQLWKNLGGGKFEDITASAGVGVPGKVSVSASFADIDNDGDADLYVTTVRGGNMMFENDGHGHFRDITATAGLSYFGHSSAAVFFDYDRDGRLDLFLVNVGKYTTDTIAGDGYKYYVAFEDAFSGHLKPERAERSILYHNEGRNRFVDVSRQTGSGRPVMVGRRDHCRCERRRLARSLRAEHAWRRSVLRERRWQEVREEKPPACFRGPPWGSMGIKVFDFNNDGRLDIFSPTCIRT